MAAAGGESVVVGLAVAAGSLVLQMFGVAPEAVFAAVGACFIGSPFAKPAGGLLRAFGRFMASVIVTCHAAAGVAAASGVWVQALAVHERKMQALAAVVIGVLLHVVVSHAPALVAGLLKRFGVVQT